MASSSLARTLKDVFNTANPTPLQSGDPRYVDLTAVRGNEDVVTRLFKAIDGLINRSLHSYSPGIGGAANPPNCFACRNGWRMRAMW